MGKQPVTVTYGSVPFLPFIPAPTPPPPAPPPVWPSQIKGLYNVVEDPRELNDLQDQMPDMVAKLHARLIYWNATTVPSIHTANDPKGAAHRSATGCDSPW